MFVHMSIHQVRHGKEKPMIESMRRFGVACRTQEGCLDVKIFQDQDTGRLIGMTTWLTKKQWQSARDIMTAAVEHDPFDDWETKPPEVYHLEEVWDD